MLPKGPLELEVRLEGLRELDKVLAGLPKGTARAQLRAALRKAAKPALRAAKQNLQAASWDAEEVAAHTKIFTLKKTRIPAAIAVGPEKGFWWTKLHEYGFYNRPPEPSIRKAWDQNKRGMADNFAREMAYVLERLAKRLVKQAYAGKLSASGRKALGL